MDERLRIKELAAEDRPREKMLLKGASSLSDAELIALLIGSGNSQETAVQLAQRILNSVGNNLNALGKLTVRELMAYRGIGEAKAVTIVAAMELGRRRGLSEPPERPLIRSSEDAFRLFYPLLCDLPHEELRAAFISRSGKVIEQAVISRGGTSETSADLRIVMKGAINTLCSGIILCHNHPSGNIQPSPQDDHLTTRLQKAAQLMDIRLLDHIIISDKSYYSYADEGKLPDNVSV
ncbi:DNA repair protein RadC [Tannerella sp.]|uniref:RadC family protein n=1 Tax=Tannerella sp. TaxID=2382127 RepID=UPI0026DB2898|nr:DNA repair protein RadC [Tannerella sp.]MDO4704233.1 DNA repair protein RadC [Tannerella sp.]